MHTVGQFQRRKSGSDCKERACHFRFTGKVTFRLLACHHQLRWSGQTCAASLFGSSDLENKPAEPHQPVRRLTSRPFKKIEFKFLRLYLIRTKRPICSASTYFWSDGTDGRSGFTRIKNRKALERNRTRTDRRKESHSI